MSANKFHCVVMQMTVVILNPCNLYFIFIATTVSFIVKSSLAVILLKHWRMKLQPMFWVWNTHVSLCFAWGQILLLLLLLLLCLFGRSVKTASPAQLSEQDSNCPFPEWKHWIMQGKKTLELLCVLCQMDCTEASVITALAQMLNGSLWLLHKTSHISWETGYR